VLSGLGKAFLTVGLLLLFFVAYQLWGTGIYTARAQAQLEESFEEDLGAVGTTVTSVPDNPVVGTPPTTVAPPAPAPPSPEDGDALAHLVIPKIGVDTYVVEGVDDGDLRKGPGHYPGTPLPGQAGNSAIAGHRTTYGAPFGELDGLEVGDVMTITTVQGTFDYRVYEKLVVTPDASEVLDPVPARPAVLTLTTCHPKYSAEERLIVKGELVLPAGVEPLASSVDPNAPEIELAANADALSGDSGPYTPVVVAGLVLALVGGVWWLVFHRHPRWTTWLLGVVPFAVVLMVFYYRVERALPASY
jgi:sortase A